MRMLPPTVVSLILLSSLAAAGVASADRGPVTVTDGVRALVADAEGGVATLRRAAGLAATATSRGARDGARASTVTVRFHFEATAAIQGIQLDITYPLAKGGFVGSADGVACSSTGDGFLVANDRDDGTMALIQASAFPLTFPFDIRCQFSEAAGATLAAGDIGVTVVEVTEDGAVGDPSHLQPTVELPPPSICDGGAIRFTSEGGFLDPGWTGIYHRSEIPTGGSFTVPLVCRPGVDVCSIDGDGLVGQSLGPPLPLSSAGVGICVVTSFRAAPTGTFDCGFGCSAIDLPLHSLVYLTADLADPCPPCVADPTPNDGIKGGTCAGGTTPGAACDVNGVVSLFDAAGPDFGHTSLDCLPAGPSVGELDLDVNPLSSSSAILAASEDCREPSVPAGGCHCPDQLLPNQCLDGVCSTSGVCEAGPIDGRCSGQPFRFCAPGSGTEGCEDVFPGAGTCDEELRRCFPSTIVVPGHCAIDGNTGLTAAFCVPPTRAAAINQTMGLPGPAALALSATLTPVSVPRAGPCSETPMTSCRGVAPGHESTLLLKDHPGADDELAWRLLGSDATAAQDFGRPDVDTDVDVCVYAAADTSPTLIFAARAASGDAWRTTPNGAFIYRDPNATADGLTRIYLTPGVAGKSRIIVKGRGLTLPLPSLPIAPPPLVQLQTNNGNCWEAAFATNEVLRNDAKRVRAITRR